MKSTILKIGIWKLAVAVILGAILVMPLVAWARLVQERRLEREAIVYTPVTATAQVLKEMSFSAPTTDAYLANLTAHQHNILAAASPGFGTILAGAALLLPFGLSTRRFWRTNRAA